MTSANKSTFRFFDLPRELRDNIYCMAWGREMEVNMSKEGFCRLVSMNIRIYSQNMLLVSRRFGQEYKQTLGGNPRFQAAHIHVSGYGEEAVQQNAIQPLLRDRLSEIRTLGLLISGRLLHSDRIHDGSQDSKVKLKHELRTLFSSTPALREIDLYSVVDHGWFEWYLTHFGAADGLTNIAINHWLFADLTASQASTVKLKHTLMMKGRLFSVRPQSVHDKIAARAEVSFHNKIYYSCKPSTEAYNYKGLQLKAAGPCGSFEAAWAAATAAEESNK